MAKHHDAGYKELFSHPEFVEALLDGFVPRPISQLLDHSTLASQPGHYITPLLDEKIEDAVWSVQFRADASRHATRSQRNCRHLRGPVCLTARLPPATSNTTTAGANCHVPAASYFQAPITACAKSRYPQNSPRQRN